MSIGIIRSDYMFHNAISGDTSRGILQVELNTIASSFGCLSNKISDMHRLFDAASGEALPPNDSIRDIARGMVAANGEYRRQTNATETVVLFIVQVLFLNPKYSYFRVANFENITHSTGRETSLIRGCLSMRS